MKSVNEVSKRQRTEDTPAIGPRAASSGQGWHEVLLNTVQAGRAGSAAESVALGHSFLIIPSLATISECSELCSSATAAARTLSRSDSGSGDLAPSTGRQRMPVLANFELACQMLCDHLLLRQLALIQAELPSLVKALLGPDCLAESTCLNNEDLVLLIGTADISHPIPPHPIPRHPTSTPPHLHPSPPQLTTPHTTTPRPTTPHTTPSRSSRRVSQPLMSTRLEAQS